MAAKSSVNLHSVQTLEELHAALRSFDSGARAPLNAAELEIRRTLDWFDGRKIHWQNEAQRRQEALDQAQAALARCEASGNYDREGRYQPPNCTAYERALREAHLSLREAQDNLLNVESWKRTVQQAIDDCRRQAQQFATLLDNDLPKASAFLAGRISSLRSYVISGDASGFDVTTYSDTTASPLTADVKSGQDTFRMSMATLSRQERGAWGEQAVVNDALGHEHRILLQHGGAVTSRGYDCVSWDGNSLHIWEAKNYSAGELGQSGIVSSLSAFDVEKRRVNAQQFLKDVPLDDPDRAAVAYAVQTDNLRWHIRLGPDTDISFSPLDNLVWSNVEARQYSYVEMLRVFHK